MKDLIIVGAGGFARETLEWIKDINAIEPTWNVLGFIDDDSHALDEKRCEHIIIGSISDWQVQEGQYFALCIANPQTKEKVADIMESKGADFVSIIHPQCRISSGALYGKGLIAYPGSTLGPDVIVGDFVTLLSSGLGHDAQVGDYATISSYCGINGNVMIGKRAYVGSHAVIVQGKRIGDDAFVCAGSVVLRNVKSGTKVLGNPARAIDL